MSNRPPSTNISPGDVLAGKYRVERVLGAGGMGIVVAAHHIQLDEKVALKFLLPEALGNPEAAKRFLREARAAVKIKSEHVVGVKDVGTLPNGAPYMVMEYLEGDDLATWLKQRGALPIDQAVEFVLQACVAVAEAHGRGIIHRDLKPANLFCVQRADGQPVIKVLDFGISKMNDLTRAGSGAAMTRTTAIMGTPLYMSPEHIRSAREVDERTDIWALGAILFELVAGRPPFVAESIIDLISKIANEPPPSLRSFRPDAPESLQAAVSTCLEKDRARRYRDVGEFARAILALAPQRAKASVERISGILQAAALAQKAPELSRSPATATTLSSASAPSTPRGVSHTTPPSAALTPSTAPGGSHAAPGPMGVFRRMGAITGVLAIAGAATLGSRVILRKAQPKPVMQAPAVTRALPPVAAGSPTTIALPSLEATAPYATPPPEKDTDAMAPGPRASSAPETPRSAPVAPAQHPAPKSGHRPAARERAAPAPPAFDLLDQRN